MNSILRHIGKNIASLGSGPVGDQHYLDAMMKRLDSKQSSKSANGKDWFVALTGTTILVKALDFAAQGAAKAAKKAIYFKK